QQQEPDFAHGSAFRGTTRITPSGPASLTGCRSALESPANLILRDRMSALPHPEAFVRWFRQAAPYVHAFRGRTFVIGFGRELVAERGRFVRVLPDLHLL